MKSIIEGLPRSLPVLLLAGFVAMGALGMMVGPTADQAFAYGPGNWASQNLSHDYSEEDWKAAQYVWQYASDHNGAPPPGYKGGRTFHNYNGYLPTNVEYREYDIYPREPGVDRGPKRVVITKNFEYAYLTTDHYQTFDQITYGYAG